MRITQLVCNSGEHFKKGIVSKYGLGKYTDPDKPAFWKGCYGEKQIDKICMHRSTAVLAWAGSDAGWALYRPEIVAKLKKAKHIQHIAISNFIAHDLEQAGIPYKLVPILPYDNSNIQPCPLGDSIYIYKSGFATYGKAINEQIKALMPDINFIECNFHTYKREELLEVYKKCFMGLRFIDHDGLSNTVCELGAMGRKVIWNGNTPNAIPYDKNNIDDIVAKIRYEYDNRHNADYVKVAEDLKAYLDVGDSFLIVPDNE
jgi:hypothetical protein